MSAENISVGDWLKMAVTRFNAVSTSPQLDAEILLHALTGIHRAAIYAHPEQSLTPEQLEDLQPALVRRERGEPIAYIIGRQEFWSMPLEISSATLIPRPETELLVERALERVPLNDASRVLDLGTGSGAIALAIAHARAHTHVVAVDVSRDALVVARNNRRTLGIDNLEIKHSDWFSELNDERFDVIVSNPPYIAINDPDLSPAVANFEPAIALYSGPTGFEAIECIVKEAREHLTPKGWLLFEHGWKQGAAVRSLLVQQGYSHVRSHSDLPGHERVTQGQAP
ncbi:MAG TPA: peptide chain release factor N(5)-glutamine methyltransferase [Steroidobacteraceae bacterium]|nr:peptide chain release factor N(5)-glutamine methyltransferase [Steroidobacteraceae bacterium]